MEKKDILAFCRKKNGTVLDFPDRGPWGDSRYRGNCSGWIIAYLIWRYRVQSMGELFAGGGTGSDVCRDLQVKYCGADLNPCPARNDILTLDAVHDAVPDGFRDADMVFMHPPYGAEIGIPYAGSMYPDPDGILSGSDLGQMPWNEFTAVLNRVIMKYYAAMSPGAKLAVLMGDVRRKGVYRSMFTDIVMPGKLLQTYVKIQNNCVSDKRIYECQFTPIMHEMMYVIAKEESYRIGYRYRSQAEVDIRDSVAATWKDVVYAVMNRLRKASLSEIYSQIEGHKKTLSNPHWKDKVRQILQENAVFESPSRGIWKIAV